MGAAFQSSQAGTKGSVQPFDESRVELLTTLALSLQHFGPLLSTLCHLADDDHYPFDLIAFDHLPNEDIGPGDQSGAALFDIGQACPEDPLHSPHIGDIAVDADELWVRQGTGLHYADQVHNQAFVWLGAQAFPSHSGFGP